ncbi:hypothetical protein G9A89_001777 [Geosiphon pyriformis]|nr:hypothetical protein G9A89_001777 [Geosiphon pyriformis]
MNHNNKPSLSTGENDSSSSHQIDFVPDTTNPPECYCDFEAIAWRTSKKGKNFGRWFWRCPKFRTEDDDDKCKFFQWIDENKPVRFFSSPNNAEENSIGKSTEPIPKNLQNGSFASYFPSLKSLQQVVKRPHSDTESSITIEDDSDSEENDLVSINNKETSLLDASISLEQPFKKAQKPSPVTIQTNFTSSTTQGNIFISNFNGYSGTQQKSRPTIHFTTSQTELSSTTQLRDLRMRTPPLTPTKSIAAATATMISSSSQETFNSHIPRFSTPELLEILKIHLNRQDSVVAVHEHEKASTRAELDKAKQEMEDARNQIELLHRENSLLLREMSLLKRELSEVRGLEVVVREKKKPRRI